MSRLRELRSWGRALLFVGFLWACDEDPSPAPASVADSEKPRAPAAAAKSAAPAESASASPAASASAAAAPKQGCPDDMKRVEGATFRIGSPPGPGMNEEVPRYDTKVATFCFDEAEVTVAAYAECVKAGACDAAETDRRFCNADREGRAQHPINCIDWHRAKAYCTWRGKRLPRETEWEYAARGGTEYRSYSWGNEPPNVQRTCWKHPGGSCEVKSKPAGAFGLYDVTGNVWEWTEDWFGKYPWPPVHGTNKVYRGGSWSRRFAKWMRTRLRNRYEPTKWGSHLGVRCALTPPEVECPYGRSEDGRGCSHGVENVQCTGLETWNGVRCAREGAAKCPKGRKVMPGHGCVLEQAATGPAPDVETKPVARSRTPGFDADCKQHYPGRPRAFRYTGGTHAKRNHVSGGAGCSNRDVGLGWNSTCCP